MKAIKITAVLAMVIIFACNKNPNEKLTFEDPDSSPEIVNLGDSLFKSLIDQLSGELKSAIQSQGVKGAVTVCNEKALPLTRAVFEGRGDILKIKRTSKKVRNPENAPDKYELLALDYFDDFYKRNGKLPERLLQKIELPEETEYRYYKPLKIQAVCLNCHGDPDVMNPELLDHIRQLYPLDKAVGYELDDFRGLVEIIIGG